MEAVIIGVEPEELKTGMQLSPQVREKVPRIVELVDREIENLLGNK